MVVVVEEKRSTDREIGRAVHLADKIGHGIRIANYSKLNFAVEPEILQ